LAWGAGPRAVQFLVIGAKARALMNRRTHVTIEDVRALALPVMRHRIVVNFAAESDGVSPDDIITSLVESTPTLEDELTNDARFQAIFAS
jgi:MoxR-like ATPase